MASYTPEQLLPRLEVLRNEAVDARNDLRGLYPGLPDSDPRVVVARHIKAAISASYLSLIHLHENLQETKWWYRQGFGAAVKAGNVQDELNDYMTLLVSGLIMYPFALFEAGLRRIMRAIDPHACLAGAAEFKSIYEWLLRRLEQDGWTYEGGQAVEFLDLYRHLRNTIHNNGTFYSRTRMDTDVTWRDTLYKFKHATPPAFLNWDFNLTLVGELVRLNKSLMRAGLIQKLGPIP